MQSFFIDRIDVHYDSERCAKICLEKVILYVSSDESPQEWSGACTTVSDEATGKNCPAAPGVSYSVKGSYRRAADVDTR